jgi:pyruvate kinase
MQSTQAWEYTKIVATIGPASDEPAKLEELMLSGVNVARLNTKHSTAEWHAERIDRIRAASKKVGKPVAILLDLQGPEIRVDLKNKEAFDVKERGEVFFVSAFKEGMKNQIKIPQNVVESLNVGNIVSLEDGTCEFEVVKKQADMLTAEALTACVCKDRKTMNTPGIVIDMPSLIDSDIEKIDMIQDHPVDFVALSFVRNKTDIDILKAELAKRKVVANIVAKIENQAAIENLEEIIVNSDAVMVARGDLGVETPMEELAFQQKEIIKRCRVMGKPVITATQMLKSMVENPRPTRAEVCDVANAVFDGTDAVMLSEESAMGKYPIETVRIMRKIVHFNELKAQVPKYKEEMKTRTTAVTKMAMSLLDDKIEPIDKVMVLTETGYTAQQLVRHRPHTPVIVITDRKETVLKSSLFYGTWAIAHPFPEGKILDLQV